MGLFNVPEQTPSPEDSDTDHLSDVVSDLTPVEESEEETQNLSDLFSDIPSVPESEGDENLSDLFSDLPPVQESEDESNSFSDRPPSEESKDAPVPGDFHLEPSDSSALPELSHTPPPPPEIRLPRTGPRVSFYPITDANDHNNALLHDLTRHENIVDFSHVDADACSSDSDDNIEDPAYDHRDPPSYIERFKDIRTLQELINQNKKPPGIPTSKHFPGLPEPLIWHVLISTLRATTYLHTGQKVHSDEVPDGWDPIVHNDIIPANIIFTHPASKLSHHLPFRYGRCMLGNFGRCLLLSYGDPLGHDDTAETTPDRQTDILERREQFEVLYHAGEKTGFEAPEIVGEEYTREEFEKEYPGPWSDLWSIGAVIVAMMTGRNVWDLILEIEFEDHAQANYCHGQIEERWRHVSMDDRHELLRSFAGAQIICDGLSDLYSRDLRMLAEGLLASNPWDRGLSPHVLREVETKYGEWKKRGFRIYENDVMYRKKYDAGVKRMRQAVQEAEKYLADLDKKHKAEREAQ